MTIDNGEAALEIIRATNDGDDLAPHHLKLVEMAVNGFLNEKGQQAFEELLANVRGGYSRSKPARSQH